MTDLSNQQTLSVIQTANSYDSSYELARTIAEAADERKGNEIVLLKVGDVTVIADYFVLVTGYSKVQVRAIARSIEDAVEEKLGRRPLRSEGFSESTWVLEDYGDVIVHVLMPQERGYYDLEAFWGHAERVEFSSSQA